MTSTTSRTTSASAMARSAWALTWASRGSSRRQPAAGVDHGEGPPAPLGVELLAVAGHAGPLLDHRRPTADDAVDQRGLADVGPSGDDHQRPFRGLRLRARPPVAGHRGAPSVTGTRSERPTVRTGPVTGACRLEGPAEGEPVGGHHLDRPGQVGRGPGRRGSGPPTGRRRAGGSGGPPAAPRSDSTRSVPVRRPETPMLPPKKLLATGTRRMSSRPRPVDQRAEHPGAVLAGEDGDGRPPARRSGPDGEAATGPGSRRPGPRRRRRRSPGARRGRPARPRRRPPRRPGPCPGRSRAGGSPRRWRRAGKGRSAMR